MIVNKLIGVLIVVLDSPNSSYVCINVSTMC